MASWPMSEWGGHQLAADEIPLLHKGIAPHVRMQGEGYGTRFVHIETLDTPNTPYRSAWGMTEIVLLWCAVWGH